MISDPVINLRAPDCTGNASFRKAFIVTRWSVNIRGNTTCPAVLPIGHEIQGESTMALTGTDYINHFNMHFDGGDMINASLYLCTDSSISDAEIETVIQAMREAGLWSADPAKTVADEHKPMYAEQMQFIGAVAASLHGKTFHAAAYDHEKFKYTPSRWQEWQSFLAANFA